MKANIPFNKPFITGFELSNIQKVFQFNKFSGNGYFTKRCQEKLQEYYLTKKVLLTTSCTDALEMAALLLKVGPGDEIIMPSYTFVSTANAFLLSGAKVIFADSSKENPNVDVGNIISLVTNRTRVIVIVHYAGMCPDMGLLLNFLEDKNIALVEDAAQAIGGMYKEKKLGTIGTFGTLSFHETKNIIAGEGGALLVNNHKYSKDSEIVWEKGTNRAAFFRGEVDKYGWESLGSSYLPSELIAAFLYGQLGQMKQIQRKRINIWNHYYKLLKEGESRGFYKLPYVPEYTKVNGHLFYIVCSSILERQELISYLKERGVQAVFHYRSLHRSNYFRSMHDGRELPMSDMYSDCLLRLPLFYELKNHEVEMICDLIYNFYHNKR